MLSWEKKLEGIDSSQQSFAMCFGCGQENPIGLKLKFNLGQGEATSEFTPGEIHQGWKGFVHGGIICAILDEAMAYCYFPRLKGVTAKVEFRFRQPAPVGVPMVVTAKLVRETRKLLTTKAVIRLNDGTVVAEGTGTSYVMASNQET